MSLPVEVSLKRLATDFLVFCMERNEENRPLTANCKGQKIAAPYVAKMKPPPYWVKNRKVIEDSRTHPIPKPSWQNKAQKQRSLNLSILLTIGHKKSGAQIAPPNHAAEI